jgi:ketosteroid isomerase-like protein
LYDSGVEFDGARSPLGQVEGGGAFQGRGYDALRDWFRKWHQAWENVVYDCEELIDAGDEHVVSFVTMRARGRTSGLSIERPQINVWTIRDAKVTRVVWFPTREEALEAVGLSG